MKCNECTASPMTLSRTSKPAHGLYTIRHFTCPVCGHEESYHGTSKADRQYDYKLNKENNG